MEPASRRVKSIYSAIASPNRLEVLRILSAKGPLSYSELKALAGFRSKKESGKFAYHLRKLVRQTLVSLNRAERKYFISGLGRLVLNLTKQIEEQSLLESGKLYVRTSRQSVEEFDPDKILRSLIKEASMPMELAQRITNETERRILKFQTVYLTAPLIREVVNSVLIEHGYEEYRHRLTRLGMPVFDVKELMDRASRSKEGVEAIIGQTAKAVLSEYLLLAQLPRDAADAHLAGDLHLSSMGCWGLMPDVVFIDLPTLHRCSINLGGRLLMAPRPGPPTTMDQAISNLALLTSLLSREVSQEICYDNFLGYIHKFGGKKDPDELGEIALRAFQILSLVTAHAHSKPMVFLRIDPFTSETKGAIGLAILDAYKKYAKSTPSPQVGLVVALPGGSSDTPLVKHIASIILSGGRVAISTQPEEAWSYSGLRRSALAPEPQPSGFGVIHSLSLNLPRLSYEAHKDGTYFRAKLALLLRSAAGALVTRRRAIGEAMAKGLLPVLAHNPAIVSAEHVCPAINLVGLPEAVSNLVDEGATPSERRELVGKILDTAVKFADEKGRGLEEKVGVCIMKDEGADRFFVLDAEKYGKSVVVKGERKTYTQIPHISAADLSQEDIMEEMARFFKVLSGFSVAIKVPPKANAEDIGHIISEGAKKLHYFKLSKRVILCRNCGAKSSVDVGRCKVCNSTVLTYYSTA